MAKFNFFKNVGYSDGMQRQALISKYNNARLNLLIVIIFTAVNMALVVANLDTYFLFSANIPYLITLYGAFFCGMFPKEYYVENGLEGMFFFDKSFFVVMLLISVLILAIYFICWLFSKKGKALWLKIALGLFIADTVLMLILGSSGSFIMDLAFHVWVIVILISGIKAQKKIGDMPADSIIEAEYTEIPDSEANGEADSSENAEASVTPEIESPTEEATENDNENIAGEGN